MGGALNKGLKLKDKRRSLSRCFFKRANSKNLRNHIWKTSQARCVGTSHIETGSPCQDQVASKRFDNGITVIALSDGAGSSKYSHYGAFIVVHRAIDLVAEHFDEAFGGEERKRQFKKRFISTLQRDLNEAATVGINLTEEERIKNGEPSREEALLVPCSIRQLACTLLAVAIKGDRYIALHIGDGVIGAEINNGKHGQLIVISDPNNGEFANETQFVVSGNAADEARLITGRINGQCRVIDGFILMSDGPEAALYNKNSRSIAPACAKLFEANRILASEVMNNQLFTTIKTVIQRKTNDDCSIVLATLKQ